MSDGSDIEWCDATWQPVVGCSRISRGCENCYAIATVHRFRKKDGLTVLRPPGARRPGLDWSGRVQLQPERLGDPLRWGGKRGTVSKRIFVCSQSDLFHDQVPFEFIAAVFGVMAACPQHTFLVLTKRPERAREFFAWLAEHAARRHEEAHYSAVLHARNTVGDEFIVRNVQWRGPWPLPNVHLGVSVEDQATADERVPLLLSLPAAVRWLSLEPLLGPVVLAKPMRFVDEDGVETGWGNALYHIDWIVIGGEGRGSRPFEVEWARSLLAQARGLPTRSFVKQLGSHVLDRNDALFEDTIGDDHEGEAWPYGSIEKVEHNPRGVREEYQGAPIRLRLHAAKGGDMAEWPRDLRVRELPGGLGVGGG